MSPASSYGRSLSPKKATEILTRLINDAVWLQGEPWASPKREQWTSSARAALERSFPPNSSIIQRFETAFGYAFNRDTSDEEMRQMANSGLESAVAILRSGVDQLSWEEDDAKSTRRKAGIDASQSNVSSPSPLGILRESIKAVPAVRFALGVAGIVSVIAIVKGFNVDLRIAAFGTVVLLILMTLLFIFARLTRVTPSKVTLPALIFLWFVLLLTIATASFLFTSVFLRWPVDLQNWLKQSSVDTTNHLALKLPQNMPQLKLRFRGDQGPIGIGAVSETSGAIVAKVELVNTGSPSTARDWTMMVRTSQGKELRLGLLASAATGDTTLKTSDGRVIEILAQKDFIPEKTATQLIPTGGAQVGFVAFEFPLSERKQIEQLGSTFTVSVTDVAGQVTAQQLTTVWKGKGDDKLTYVPGMQPNSADGVDGGPLKEWQQVLILQTLSQYPGHKVLIFAGLGSETAAYASQFSHLFRKANWVVEGPRPAPVNQPVLDLQISIDERIYTHPEIQAIMSALRSARVKSRPGAVHNHNVASDWIVLWVGARTPEDEPLHVPLDVPPGTFAQLR